ncbi:sensor histidine kinase [Nocardioides okcheonensis]|uniref:sensor histidine kinase n=1 Tax=Nocardioides okcheonensis TaxID=2894081 RepID=UPI001E5D566E|nr:sensor histidine kinase [Nocardioides okcheonensis]UFN42731.1 sensor histidine kinase [Nocardioides okcheonensis]
MSHLHGPASTAEDPSSPWQRWGWAMAVIWLGFLFFPVASALQSDAPPLATTATLAAIAVFAVLYVLGYTVWSQHALLVLAGLVTLTAALVPVLGVDALGVTPYLGAYSALQVPAPQWRWTTPAIAAVPVLSLFGSDDFPVFFFILVWPIIGGCTIVRLLTDAEVKADATRQSLALVAERERVARDVHDVLGHSLTALSVKAELAARLIDLDPERAKAELESIQETARSALAEVRATVGGLRAANLDAEVTAAPRVLADAGVTTEVVGEVADTDPRHRALLAWVLRESVTNVVRHSGAGSVRIELGAHGIAITDDGAGPTGPEGNGLRGMRERVQGAGGTLTVTPATPGTRVEVGLP